MTLKVYDRMENLLNLTQLCEFLKESLIFNNTI